MRTFLARSDKVGHIRHGGIKNNRQCKKDKRETAVSQGLITFVLPMYKHLTREQRYAIYPGKQKKQTNKAIARLIGGSESTVSRELKRNATKNGKYVRDKADALSEGGRRQAVRRLGDGPDCRQGRQRHPHDDRTQHELPHHGETQAWQEGHAAGKDRMEAAHAIQGRESQDHHYGQRK